MKERELHNYLTRLRNSSLLRRAVWAGDSLCVPIGGHRKAGAITVDPENPSLVAFGEYLSEQPGFPNLRIVRSTLFAGGNPVQVDHDLCWGKSTANTKASVARIDEQYHRRLGRNFGYKESAISEFVRMTKENPRMFLGNCKWTAEVLRRFPGRKKSRRATRLP
jgi:hypothetical protein